MASHKPEIVVPGFPEIVKFQPMCRICQLARTKTGLVELIHKYRRDEQMGTHALQVKMQPILERQGESAMHAQVFIRHFTNHVNFGDGVATPPEDFTFVRASTSASEIGTAEIELLQVNPEDGALGKNDSDYHNMWDLFRRLMRRVAALDADPTTFITDNGKHDLAKLNIWAGIINTARGCLTDLNKMRNSDRLTVSILESHTKTFTAAVAQPLAATLLPLQEELAQHTDPNIQAIAARINDLLQVGVVDIFQRAAEDSMRRSKDQFKLLN